MLFLACRRVVECNVGKCGDRNAFRTLLLEHSDMLDRGGFNVELGNECLPRNVPDGESPIVRTSHHPRADVIKVKALDSREACVDRCKLNEIKCGENYWEGMQFVTVE